MTVPQKTDYYELLGTHALRLRGKSCTPTA